MKPSACSCGASIVWVMLCDGSGRSVPCDAVRATVITVDGRAVAGHRPHMSHCPHADHYRKDDKDDQYDLI